MIPYKLIPEKSKLLIYWNSNYPNYLFKMLKKKFKYLLPLILLCTGLQVIAQIGIGTTSPHTSSILDVESTTKGVLPPRMTTLERDAINSGTFAEGLIVYNTDENCLNFYNSSNWINPCTGSVSAPVPPAALPGSIILTPGQTAYIASIYDNDYLPYTEPTAVAATGTAVADGANEILINVQGVLNTTTGLKVKIPYTVTTGTVSLPAFNQTRTVIADHIQGANPLSNDGGGTPVEVEFSYDAATLNVGSGTIVATIKAVSNPLNAVKLDVNAGIGTDFGILMAEFSIAINDAGDTGPVYLKGITAIPDRNIADADHKFLYIPKIAADGNLWLNNNLGANYANLNHAQFNPGQQATMYNDHHAYGSLYQWGRYSDGHELMNWTNSTTGTPINITTTTSATSNTPGHNLFILNNVYFDWRNPQNNDLWQGESGINNPCPLGYRLPTQSEISDLLLSESITNYTNAASSTLAFTVQPFRQRTSGNLLYDSTGTYWTSSTGSLAYSTSGFFQFRVTTWNNSTNGYRANGYSLRCIKD